MRAKKNNKKLIIAISLGMLATVGVFSMVNNQKSSIEALNQKLAQQQAAALASMQAQQSNIVIKQDETTNTILAKTDIKAGEIITINKIEKKEYKKSELPPGFFINENFVLGKSTSQYIPAGKIITGEDILAVNSNSLNIPPGMRAITIPTSLIQGLASYIYIGSKIDLVSTKSPPEFIAQNIKIIALETTPDIQLVTNQAVPEATAPVPPAGAPVAPSGNTPPSSAPPAANSPSFSPAPVVKKNISADKALGITVLVPIDIARKVIDAMLAGKLQILTRGNNDDKIFKQTPSFHIPHLKNLSMLPPPPSGPGKLPSLPGNFNPNSMPMNKPKPQVEIIEANNKRQVSFDDSNNIMPVNSTSQGNNPPKDLNDFLKLPN